jgi:hypothetical protein
MGLFSGITKAFSGLGGSLISGGASLAGGILANAGRADASQQVGQFNLASARETNQFNAEEAQKNRDFQQRNSDTAHQRQVTDLRAAGLNPILSAKYGGASSPSGGQASGIGASQPMYDQQDIFSPAINSALSTYQTQNQGRQIESQINKMAQEIEESKSRANLTDRQRDRIDYEIPNLISQAFTNTESGNLAIRNTELSRLNAKISELSFQEKEILLKKAQMDLQILQQPETGELYRKLTLLKGVNAGSAAAVASDEAVQFVKKLINMFK